MNFLLSGHNTKTSLESEITFSEGDKILCEPGDGFCSARLLEQVLSGATASGFFKDTYDVAASPSFGSGEFALRVHPGMNYALTDAENVVLGDSIDITHISDPNGKRYVEVWVTYYPSVQVQPEVESYDVNSLVTATGVSIKPKIYPELIQSITRPPEATGLFVSAYEKFVLSDSGNKVLVYDSSAVVLYTWNGSGYDQDLIHHSKGTVRRASVENNEIIVTYDNPTGFIDFYTESGGSWSNTRTEDWPYSYRDVLLNGDYILVGGVDDQDGGRTLLKSDLSIFHEAENTNYLGVVPADYYKPAAYNTKMIGIETAAVSVLGGPQRYRLAYIEYETSDEALKLYGGPYSEGYDPYLPEGEDHVSFTGYIMLRHPYGPGVTEGFFLKTSHGELFPYDYLDGEYCASQGLSSFGQDSSYVMDEFLVNFNGRVYYAAGPEDLIDLYAFSFPDHKIYSEAFHPVKYPYFMVNNDNISIKLVEPVKTHFDEVPDAVLTLRYSSAAEVTGVTGFTAQEQPSGTSTSWLISDNNTDFYTWNGSSWVLESDIVNGCTLQNFIEGCTAGFTTSQGAHTVYVKLLMSSTIRDSTPEFSYSNTLMTLSTLGDSDEAFLCDDSLVEISHYSDTLTRVTSKMQEEVILSAQVCIVAPPYNEDFDG